MAARKVCVGSGYKSPKFVIDPYSPYIQLRRSAASEPTPLSLLLPSRSRSAIFLRWIETIANCAFPAMLSAVIFSSLLLSATRSVASSSKRSIAQMPLMLNDTIVQKCQSPMSMTC